MERIPSSPKSNCYFILKLKRDSMDYDAASANKLNIQDRLRDGTGGWDATTCCNFNFYKVDNGHIKFVRKNKSMNEIQIYDSRSHRATYSATVSSSRELLEKAFSGFGTRIELQLLDLQLFLILDLPTSLECMETQNTHLFLISALLIPVSTHTDVGIKSALFTFIKTCNSS